MANPLLIKGLLCLVGVGAATLTTVKLIEKQPWKESVQEEGNKPIENAKVGSIGENNGVSEEKVETNTPEQAQCSFAIDKIAKDIKKTFSTYYTGDWDMKSNPKELSAADKTAIEKEVANLERWKSNTSSNCKNSQSIEGEYGEIMKFLKKPELSKTKESYRDHMKSLLKKIGSSTGDSY